MTLWADFSDKGATRRMDMRRALAVILVELAWLVIRAVAAVVILGIPVSFGLLLSRGCIC